MKKVFPNFLCLHLPQAEKTSLNLFTPRVMQFCENVWLMDLSPCESYWQLRAKVVDLERDQLIQKVLRESYGQDLQAALAYHPWQAILMTFSMRARGVRGLLSRESEFGRILFTQISWEVWFEAAEKCANFFNPNIFLKQLKQMRQSLNKLHLHLLNQLDKATEAAFKRRFGASLALLWQWTQKSSDSERFEDFPWVPWKLEEKPRVVRHLDYPLWQWENIEPFLREDLDKLCNSPLWSPTAQVLQIHWQLTLNDLQPLKVEICFRHPHSLHQEGGEHKTALLQAHFAFMKSVGALFAEIPNAVIGWQISVEESIVLPLKVVELFSENISLLSDLAHLENQLPIPLQQFDICPDGLPEDSFVKGKRKEKIQPLWLELARTRPMFIYQQPRPIDIEGKGSSVKFFLERVSEKWWDEKNMHRDYYCHVDKSKRRQWVYQDASGQWYLHGLFG